MPIKALTTDSGKPDSRFSFGTMQFGGRADERESRSMFDASRAAGINFFDTAYVYNEGHSETLLGNFAGKEREDLLIATKCASVGGSGAANIRSQFDISRQRLGMETVNVFLSAQVGRKHAAGGVTDRTCGASGSRVVPLYRCFQLLGKADNESPVYRTKHRRKDRHSPTHV